MDKNSIKFKRGEFVYMPEQRGVYPIAEDDWALIKRMIERVPPSKRKIQDATSIFIGIFFSALLSLIGFYIVPGVPMWIYVVVWTLTIVSLILSIVLYLLSKQQKEEIITSIDEVKEEMELIENKFVKK